MSQDEKLAVRNFMIKDVLTVNSYETLKQVAKKLYLRKVGSAIIPDDGKPSGIVTNRDIVNCIGSFDLPLDSPVSKIMSKPLVSITSGKSILDAANTMNEKNIRKIPVIEQGSLIGIISASDLAVLLKIIEKEDLEKIVKPYVN